MFCTPSRVSIRFRIFRFMSWSSTIRVLREPIPDSGAGVVELFPAPPGVSNGVHGTRISGEGSGIDSLRDEEDPHSGQTDWAFLPEEFWRESESENEPEELWWGSGREKEPVARVDSRELPFEVENSAEGMGNGLLGVGGLPGVWGLGVGGLLGVLGGSGVWGLLGVPGERSATLGMSKDGRQLGDVTGVERGLLMVSNKPVTFSRSAATPPVRSSSSCAWSGSLGRSISSSEPEIVWSGVRIWCDTCWSVLRRRNDLGTTLSSSSGRLRRDSNSRMTRLAMEDSISCSAGSIFRVLESIAHKVPSR
mmetsp:Transcript_26/g.64  ORF Transcript_26/g.64 Transcript_26/m.64 type:complete len:307 (+) Transcript_26:633-1553(+)